MINKYNRILLPLFFITDVILIIVSFILAYHIRFDFSKTMGEPYYNLLYFIVLSWLIFSFIFQTYLEKQAKTFKWHFNRLFIAQLVLLFTIFSYVTVFKGHFLSRKFLALFIFMQFFLLLIVHIARHYLVVGFRKKGRNLKKMIVLGELSDNDELIECSQNNPEYGYRIENCIHYKGPEFNYAELLKNALKERKYDELLVLSPALLGNQIKPIIDVAEDFGLRVLIVPKYLKTFSNRLTIDYLNSRPVMSIRYEPLLYLHNRLLKRTFDIFFSLAVILCIYWWLYLIVGFFIKISSKGPVIFKQKRIGVNGEEFICYKFRTMQQSDEEEELAENGYGKITTDEDERVTWIGKILRKTNLDEFPQFINVLKGEMSIVGPRPHMIQEDLEIRTKVPKYRIRQFIKPGITGWAAVNGYRGGTTDVSLMRKRVEYDLYYLESWSFWLDIKIILMTIWQMLTFRTRGK